MLGTAGQMMVCWFSHSSAHFNEQQVEKCATLYAKCAEHSHNSTYRLHKLVIHLEYSNFCIQVYERGKSGYILVSLIRRVEYNEKSELFSFWLMILTLALLYFSPLPHHAPPFLTLPAHLLHCNLLTPPPLLTAGQTLPSSGSWARWRPSATWCATATNGLLSRLSWPCSCSSWWASSSTACLATWSRNCWEPEVASTELEGKTAVNPFHLRVVHLQSLYFILQHWCYLMPFVNSPFRRSTNSYCCTLNTFKNKGS